MVYAITFVRFGVSPAERRFCISQADVEPQAAAGGDGVGGRMRAVILAAGRGGRLQGVIGNQPKCLARVGATRSSSAS